MRNLKGKKIAVLGLDIVGLNLIRALAKAGAQVVGFGHAGEEENKQIEVDLKKIGVEVVFHSIPEEGLLSFDEIILAPMGGAYLEAYEFAKRQGKSAQNDLDFVLPLLKGKIIGVTGTCGKSSTVEMLHAMLVAQKLRVNRLGGETLDWGKAILDGKSYDYHLIEIGSSRLERSEKFHPHIAALLNIFPAHGERHEGSLVKYVEAKAKIFQHQGAEDYLIFNGDAFNLHELIRVQKARSKQVPFSLTLPPAGCGIYHSRGKLLWFGENEEEESFDLAGTRLRGFPTRMMNAMAAIAMAKLCGIESKIIQVALEKFRPLPGRLHRVRKLDGVTFVDDSQSNNIGAAIWALNSFSKPILWIGGGEIVEGSRLNRLPRQIIGKVKKCLVIGTLAVELGELLKEKIEVLAVKDLPKAVELANQMAEEGDIVLFSPACPPDRFNESAGKNRSEIFRQAVAALPRTPRQLSRYREFTKI